MQKIAYLLDTGINYNLNATNNIHIVPIQIIINNKKTSIETIYQDGVNFSEDDLNNFLNSKDIDVMTSQANIGLVSEKIEKLCENYDHVIFLCLSSKLSGMYSTFKSLEKNNKKLVVIDSLQMGIAGNWLLEDINSQINNGLEIKSIQNYVYEWNKNCCGFVIVKNLDQLIKGGRISPLKGLLGKLLSLKLVIKFYDGKLEFVKKDNDLTRAINKGLEAINNDINYQNKTIERVSIMPQLSNQKENDEIIKYCSDLFPNINIELAKLPTAIVAHTGLDTISILLKTKND